MPASHTPTAAARSSRVFAGIGLAGSLLASLLVPSAFAQDGRRPVPAEYQQSAAAEDDPRAQRRMPQRKGEITFDNLKFDIEKDGKFEREMLTKEIEKLNNQTIQIRGFILPASVMQMKNIKKFVLVRDNQECCFGPGAALYDCIIVQMKGEATAEFTTRPVAVKGKFKIKEFKYPGDEGHYAIYEMEATAVE
ncbi:DUF3299 domain-containing protein [Candidatus Laterigemmans baculatus]|uniref:DUF3299 domain-containing protein n=1 Tax=Candidatus Laterigemmans baculatus TaxID=2770505 RepID=UPI0013D9269E|nr:DUF3299 domain-containing protein [Candidatus Laterigemmans baculatus]